MTSRITLVRSAFGAAVAAAGAGRAADAATRLHLEGAAAQIDRILRA